MRAHLRAVWLPAWSAIASAGPPAEGSPGGRVAAARCRVGATARRVEEYVRECVRVAVPVVVRRLRVTTTYVGALAVIEAGLLVAGPVARSRLVAAASTNLSNLTGWRLDTLLSSAFVTDTGPAWVWLPGLAALLAPVEYVLGWRRLLRALVVSHVGATVLVAAGLAVAVATGATGAAVATASDVGMSYAAGGALGLAISALPRAGRWPWAVGWLAVAGQTLVSDADFSAVGHLVSLTLGLTTAALTSSDPVEPVVRATRVGVVTGLALAVGAVFGAGEVGWANPQWWSVPAVAVTGGLVGMEIDRRLRSTTPVVTG